MAAFFKHLFKNKKDKGMVRDEEMRQSRRTARGGSPSNGSERIASTAPYHSVTLPRAQKGPRSCPGGTHNFERSNHINRSYESDIRYGGNDRGTNRRKQRWNYKFSRHNPITSEYGSADPSPTNHYVSYNPNLDDTDTDSWFDEDKGFRIKELEKRLYELRCKLKEYREKLRAERDLRLANERSMIEEIERLKVEFKREIRNRGICERRYEEIIKQLRSKCTALENERYRHGLSARTNCNYQTALNAEGTSQSVASPMQPYQSQMCQMAPSFTEPTIFKQILPISNPPLIASKTSMSPQSRSSYLFSPKSAMLHHAMNESGVPEVDEIKNFRNGEAFDFEVPRGDDSRSPIRNMLTNSMLTNLGNDSSSESVYFTPGP